MRKLLPSLMYSIFHSIMFSRTATNVMSRDPRWAPLAARRDRHQINPPTNSPINPSISLAGADSKWHLRPSEASIGRLGHYLVLYHTPTLSASERPKSTPHHHHHHHHYRSEQHDHNRKRRGSRQRHTCAHLAAHQRCNKTEPAPQNPHNHPHQHRPRQHCPTNPPQLLHHRSKTSPKPV